MAALVRITDVSPRDGLQNEPGVIRAADKLRLIELLAASGVDEIEATSFVSPKWVPQLGDAEEVLAGVRDFYEGVRHISGTLPRSAHGGGLPELSVLVPNDKGFEKALAVHEGGLPLKIAVFTAASETFNQKNTNATIAQSIERFRAFLPRAFAEGMSIRMYISCAIACPFEGPIAPAAVRRVAEMLLALAPDDAARATLDIDLGDTIGVAHPAEIEALLREFDPAMRERQVTVHLHDTFGRAGECVKAALAMGIRSFDGSAGGLGGCPYASTPERRAPGNIGTELLVEVVETAGFETGVDREGLREASGFARRIVEEARVG